MNKSKMYSWMMMAAMVNPDAFSSSVLPEGLEKKYKPLPPKPIPKGCAEYWFNEYGDWGNSDEEGSKMRIDETVFTCIASNHKVAIKKFEKRNSK